MKPASPMPEPLVVDAEPWTAREIRQQPETLRQTVAMLSQDRDRIEAFVNPLLARENLRIILIGAGTSAFIGDSLSPWLSRKLGRAVESIATTDIVSAPELYLRSDTPTLLVSFGRSGSSPESIAAVDLADQLVDEAYHLVITCNADGALAKRSGDETLVVVLPDATHDRGFAMTSSFTAMTMAALAILGNSMTEARISAIADAVEATHARSLSLTQELATRDFERVVYLGSGVFTGLAREAALKLMELSDGRIVTAFDSALGFRHGPKTIVNDRTLIVLFVSNDPLTRCYDLDMLIELRRDGRSGSVWAVSAQDIEGDVLTVPDMAGAPDVDLLFPFITFAQLFGYQVSQRLGLDPDQPNASGTVNRVVRGVRIHPFGA